MNKKKVCMILLCLLMILNVPLFAKSNRMGHEYIMGDLQKMKKKLDLTDHQINQIDRINQTYKRKYLTVAEQLAPLEIRLKKELIETTKNYDQIQQLLSKMEPLKTSVKMQRIYHKDAIFDTLDNQQQRKIRRLSHKKKRRSFYNY